MKARHKKARDSLEISKPHSKAARPSQTIDGIPIDIVNNTNKTHSKARGSMDISQTNRSKSDRETQEIDLTHVDLDYDDNNNNTIMNDNEIEGDNIKV